MTKNTLFFLFIISLGMLFAACSNKTGEQTKIEYYHTQGNIFNTNCNIKYEFSRMLDNEIAARLDSFNLSLNPFNEHSIIYKVNNNQDVEVDDWFITVFNEARKISEQTGGMYDITAGPLINLWGFGFENAGETTPQAIDSIRQFVGYNKVRIEGRKVIKDDPRIRLNASSIAKGYAVDLVSELLESYGIGNYMVEIGGEVHAKGVNPNGEYWKIEILKPIDDNTGRIKERLEVISLNDTSIATSGNNRNYYIKDGKKYAHTINPVTGYPSESGMLSAIVLHPQCMIADGWATAFMTLGIERSIELANQMPDMKCIFVYEGADGQWETLHLTVDNKI